jgi:23S rRNA pseudouridine1911/1915/1917 synthase
MLVPTEHHRTKLRDYLLSLYPHLTRIHLTKRLTAGLALVNGQPRDAGFRLSAGDRIELKFPTDVETGMAPENIPFTILHEDAHVLVLDKPAGLLVHPIHRQKSGTLANALAWHLQEERARPYFVHRLDRATSGLMLIAKSATVMAQLSRQFQKRTVEKRYTALADGVIRPDDLTIEAPIGRDPERRPQWNVDDRGKAAVSRVRVRERSAVDTLVELEPVTGRTNQLRIHLAFIGHPIAGDEWYGGSPAERLCLHAALLAFDHPETGRRMRLESPIDFRR